MQAGRLRNRVSIQRITVGSPGQDAGGTPTESWSTLYTCWADVSALRGRELIAAQQVASEVSGTIRIRYRADFPITSNDRVLFGARIYDILASVDPDERHRELVLYVREKVNNG